MTKEGEESAKVHEAAEDMCKDKAKDLGFAIQTGNREIEGLKAQVGAGMKVQQDILKEMTERLQSSKSLFTVPQHPL